MTRLFRVLSVALVALAIAGCAKTTKEKADEVVKEHNRLVGEINAMGTPDSSWSDSKLNAYEAKLNRLEAVDRKGEELNGKDGVLITGGYSTPWLISQGRSELASARAAKSRQSIEEPRRSQGQSSIDRYNSTVERYNSLVSTGADQYARLRAMGVPDESWSDLRVRQYDRLLDQLIANIDNRLQILSENPSLFTDVWQKKSDLTDARASLSRLSGSVKEYLRLRESEPAESTPDKTRESA
jgi:hypothetical protein